MAKWYHDGPLGTQTSACVENRDGIKGSVSVRWKNGCPQFYGPVTRSGEWTGKFDNGEPVIPVEILDADPQFVGTYRELIAM